MGHCFPATVHGPILLGVRYGVVADNQIFLSVICTPMPAIFLNIFRGIVDS